MKKRTRDEKTAMFVTVFKLKRKFSFRIESQQIDGWNFIEYLISFVDYVVFLLFYNLFRLTNKTKNEYSRKQQLLMLKSKFKYKKNLKFTSD